MKFYENLHSIVDSNEMIIDFANSCQKVHNQIKCKRRLQIEFVCWLFSRLFEKGQDHGQEKTVFYFSL